MIDDIVKENIKGKQNKLISGDNITIKDDVISATGGGGSIEQQQTDWAQTDESAVDYIKNKPTDVSTFVNDAGYLTEHQDISGKQDKLTAGSRITIEDNVISAQNGAASDVSYDNTRTGLSATNVQAAIDEMADTNLHETVVLTIGSADSSFNPVGQTITVTLEDGSATQYTVPISRQITFIVQREMRYNISGTSTNDYRVLPISVKAAIPTRYLTIRYIPIATGVFILQSDGNYYLGEEYDAATMAEDAVGVLLLTSGLINAGFGLIVAKDDVNENIAVSANTISLTTTDYTHYVGKTNTESIYAQYPTQFNIINKAMAKSVEYGDKVSQGYVPSSAEGALLLANITEINELMRTIGGVVIPGSQSKAWTSSYVYYNYAKSFLTWKNNNSEAIAYQSGQSGTLRPIYQFPLS